MIMKPLFYQRYNMKVSTASRPMTVVLAASTFSRRNYGENLGLAYQSSFRIK